MLLTKMPQQNLRIAFATPEYVTEKPFDCGLANYIHRVGKVLAGMGHEIHIVTLSETEQAGFEHEGITVHRIKVAKIWLQLNRLTRYRLATAIYLLGLSARVYRKLKELDAQRPFHLVQFPHSPYCGLVSILFLKIPFVLRASWYQAAWNDLAGLNQNLDDKSVSLMERLQLRLSPHIYSPSRTLQQILTDKVGLKNVRVLPSPCYVETQGWDYSIHNELLKDKKYLLFFGRFELRKGFHVLAQALPLFLERYPEAHVVLVGRDMKSTLAPSMAEYARSLLSAFADRVTIIDRLPHKQLYPIIAGARLVVLPSLMDNFPNACLEAMALGKPVIGTRGASFEEMINDEETGFLVAPNAPDELSEKIIAAWTDVRLEAIGDAARQKALEFAPERTVEELLSYYRKIIEGSERR